MMHVRLLRAAEMYRNQEEIGSALEKLFSEGTVKRQEIWVTSKASVLCSCLGTALTRA